MAESDPPKPEASDSERLSQSDSPGLPPPPAPKPNLLDQLNAFSSLASLTIADTERDAEIQHKKLDRVRRKSRDLEQDALGMYVGEFESLRQAFDKFDADGSGSIDREELVNAFSAAGRKVTQEEVDKLFVEIDADGDGQITFDEFKTGFNATPELSRGAPAPGAAPASA
jgi:hypothetical protein